jgi:rhamnosyltransferase
VLTAGGLSSGTVRVAAVIPTLNPGRDLDGLLDSLAQQRRPPDRIRLIDSQSTDGSMKRARRCGIEVVEIDRSTFNHGGAREQARLGLNADIVVYMTQDALPANGDAIGELIAAFSDGTVAMAYGRQLPHPDAGPFGAHAREFNYPAISETRSLDDMARRGIKACFASDSFCAYRADVLAAVGGFPTPIIVGEDMLVAAKILQAGHRLRYQASAQVYHSHDYTLKQDFSRYFDIGASHAHQRWLVDAFGEPSGEGRRLVLSELRYLWRTGFVHRLPEAFVRVLVRYAGYKVGRQAFRLPMSVRRRLSGLPWVWAQLEAK